MEDNDLMRFGYMFAAIGLIVAIFLAVEFGSRYTQWRAARKKKEGR